MTGDMRDLTDEQLAQVCRHTELDLATRQLADAIYANRQRAKVSPELNAAAHAYHDWLTIIW